MTQKLRVRRAIYTAYHLSRHLLIATLVSTLVTSGVALNDYRIIRARERALYWEEIPGSPLPATGPIPEVPEFTPYLVTSNIDDQIVDIRSDIREEVEARLRKIIKHHPSSAISNDLDCMDLIERSETSSVIDSCGEAPPEDNINLKLDEEWRNCLIARITARIKTRTSRCAAVPESDVPGMPGWAVVLGEASKKAKSPGADKRIMAFNGNLILSLGTRAEVLGFMLELELRNNERLYELNYYVDPNAPIVKEIDLTADECVATFKFYQDLYERECRQWAQWGAVATLPSFSAGMCNHASSKAAFTQQLFWSLQKTTKPWLKTTGKKCLPVWAREAGHPNPDAFKK